MDLGRGRPLQQTCARSVRPAFSKPFPLRLRVRMLSLPRTALRELPPAEDSDQRIDACRVLGVQEVEPGDRSVPSTRLALVLCLFWAWRFAFADGAFPQDLP